MIEGIEARRRVGLQVLAIGIAVLCLGLLGRSRVWWTWVSGTGAALVLAGLLGFLATLRGERLGWPHPLVATLTLLGTALHGYEQVVVMPGRLSVGWLLWGLMPYGLALATSAFAGTRTVAIAGAAAALLFDLVLHHDVATGPKTIGSAVLVMLRPLVSTLVIVPAVLFSAWRIGRLRQPPCPPPQEGATGRR